MNILYKGDIPKDYSKYPIAQKSTMAGKLWAIGNAANLESLINQAVLIENDTKWTKRNGYEFLVIPGLLDVGSRIKKTYVNGHALEIGELTLMIPILRMFPEGTLLPSFKKFYDGKCFVEIKPDYVNLSKLGEEIYNRILDDTLLDLSDAEKYANVCSILRINYFITDEEINENALFSDDSAYQIQAYSIDSPGWSVFLAENDKKKVDTSET